MIRVLQVLGGTGLGGAESRIMDIYRHMDRERVQFDFLVTRGKNGYFDAEIESLGGHIYTLPPFRIYNYKEYTDAVKNFFMEHTGYKAVHGHMTSTAAIYLPIAKKAGVPLTIAHARSAGVDSGIKGTLTNMLRKNLWKRCDKMISCSDLAAVSVFGKERYEDGKIKIMPNAIDVQEYASNIEQRNEIRKKYGVEDKFVIGHVGRFHEAKNHGFLLDTFASYLDIRDDAVLMIVGDGPLRQSIESKIEQIDSERNAQGKMGFKEKVILTGNMSPVSPFYQAFDFFLFPSLFEGMPGTVVEAQAAGVTSLISDEITRLVKITDIVEYESLKKDSSGWARRIDSIVGHNSVDELYKSRLNDNVMIQQLMTDSEYNVVNQVDYYTNLYEKGFEEKR